MSIALIKCALVGRKLCLDCVLMVLQSIFSPKHLVLNSDKHLCGSVGPDSNSLTVPLSLRLGTARVPLDFPV